MFQIKCRISFNNITNIAQNSLIVQSAKTESKQGQLILQVRNVR